MCFLFILMENKCLYNLCQEVKGKPKKGNWFGDIFIYTNGEQIMQRSIQSKNGTATTPASSSDFHLLALCVGILFTVW